MDSITMDVPYPDHDGFVEWVENKYSSDRWSDVHPKPDPKTGGSITIRSGKYPVFSRFVKDVRPHLHEHGFVIKRTRSAEKGFGDEHEITAIPILWVVAYVNGWVCKRGACRHITSDGYCDCCTNYYDEPSNPHEPVMTHP